MAGVLFGSDVWDPARIVAQIVAMQCLFYLALGLLLYMTVGAWKSARGAGQQSSAPLAAAARGATDLCPPAPPGPYVPRVTLYQLFDWRWLSFSSFQGAMVAVANICAALAAAFCLRFVVSGGAVLQQRRAAGSCWGGAEQAAGTTAWAGALNSTARRWTCCACTGGAR